jgi:UDP-N-acetylmuramate--alanine ligase
LRTESLTASRFTGRRVHFIGIGGCGMSGLARMLLDAGAIVSGSEPKPNSQTFDLAHRGATVSRDQLGELLSRDVDLVVRTAAIKDDNPEYLAARAYGIRTIKYAELLGQVMQERFGIAVAGTHGKSTTTAMIAYALLHCGADPSCVVGGTVPQLGGGSRSGASPCFVAEACEFDRSFHNLHPTVAIITNIEEDHLDCYKNIHEIIASFHRFATILPVLPSPPPTRRARPRPVPTPRCVAAPGSRGSHRSIAAATAVRSITTASRSPRCCCRLPASTT